MSLRHTYGETPLNVIVYVLGNGKLDNYVLTYLLHGEESFLRSKLVCS